MRRPVLHTIKAREPGWQPLRVQAPAEVVEALHRAWTDQGIAPGDLLAAWKAAHEALARQQARTE